MLEVASKKIGIQPQWVRNSNTLYVPMCKQRCVILGLQKRHVPALLDWVGSKRMQDGGVADRWTYPDFTPAHIGHVRSHEKCATGTRHCMIDSRVTQPAGDSARKI